MSNHYKYRLLVILIMTLFSMTAFSQSEKYVVEIRISDKEASISVDGKSIGKGKNLYEPELTAGKHTISATRPSYTTVTKTVTITENYRSRYISLASPKPIYGYISVVSEPSNIEIELDGKKTNKFTPCVLDSILIGQHSVRLSAEGYNSISYQYDVAEADTARVNLALTKKEEQKSTTYTSSYSEYSSNYSSGYSSNKSSSNSSYSSSYKSFREIEEEKYRNRNFDVYYFGIGAGLLLNLEFQLSIFDFRYKWFEIRPCLWGINLPFMQNISHTKLPPAHVDPTSEQTDYWGDVKYSMYVPERGVQIFYTPMMRFHIPIKGDKAIVLGAGPQVSWTKFSWKGRTQSLSNVSDYVFYDKYSGTSDMSYGLQKDDIWFTAEIAFLWTFTKGSDCGLYARYQDGFYIGFEYRFGRKY